MTTEFSSNELARELFDEICTRDRQTSIDYHNAPNYYVTVNKIAKEWLNLEILHTCKLLLIQAGYSPEQAMTSELQNYSTEELETLIYLKKKQQHL